MIGIEYVVAMSMAVINLFKKSVPPAAVPLLTMAVAVLLNLTNAAVYGGDILQASKDALIAGGIAVGLFAGADAIRKAEATPFKDER